jgi:electron transfer flavoprotein alpha subunit
LGDKLRVALVVFPVTDLQSRLNGLFASASELVSRGASIEAWALGAYEKLSFPDWVSDVYYSDTGGGFVSAETAAAWFERMLKRRRIDLCLVGKSIISTQVCVRLGSAPFSNVRSVSYKDGKWQILRKAYGSNLDWISVLENRRTILLMENAAGRTPDNLKPSSRIIREAVTLLNGRFTPLPEPETPETPEKREENAPTERDLLETARIVLAGGRGLNGADNFRRLRKLAAAMGGAAGASRAAAMNGWVDMKYVIGQSGATIAPDVCVMLGISGSEAFMTGVAKSKTLIAVNADPDALIFKKSDICIVADTGEMLDAMEAIAQTKLPAEGW